MKYEGKKVLFIHFFIQEQNSMKLTDGINETLVQILFIVTQKMKILWQSNISQVNK